MAYRAPQTWFHNFEAENSMAGLSFADERLDYFSIYDNYIAYTCVHCLLSNQLSHRKVHAKLLGYVIFHVMQCMQLGTYTSDLNDLPRK